MFFEIIGQAEISIIGDLVKAFGLPTVLVGFYVWQNQKDKNRLEARLSSLEEFCRGELVELTKDCTKAMIESKRAIDELIEKKKND